MEKIELEYFDRFLKLPPKCGFMNKKDPKYIKLLQKAIENNKPLTLDDFDAIPCGDVVSSTEKTDKLFGIKKER